MSVAKGVPPVEVRRCAAEVESIVWALTIIMIALIAFSTFLFVSSLGG
jgi:hypothetical protein